MFSTFARRLIGLLLLGWLLLASWLLFVWPPATQAADIPVFLPLVSGGNQPAAAATVIPPAGWSAYENRVVELINGERANNGCSVMLAKNDKLRQAAYGHSADMLARDFFDHTNPDREGPGERLARAGYSYAAWGENIAAGYTSPEEVVNGWMSSSGHRTNILNCNYTEVGVGYAYAADDPGEIRYRHYWTLVVAKPR